MRSQVDWINMYQEKGALWIHDGNPLRPHALLTSGNHSNGFFNSRLVIEDEELLRLASAELLYMCHMSSHGILSQIECVVGPQTGATLLAKLISQQITSRAVLSYGVGRRCRFASPQKHEDSASGLKSMIFTEEDKDVVRWKKVLLCEDVITTGGSIVMTQEAVASEGGKVLPFVLTLVNRSGQTTIDGLQVVALIDTPMKIWKTADCPLCSVGSQALRPKDNWAQLTASHSTGA